MIALTHNRLRRPAAPFALAAAAAIILPLLTGCQPQTIIARVNGKPISEQEFNAKVQRVKQSSFGQGQEQNMDAGGLTLFNMIQSMLIDQCAADPSLKAVPSEDTLKAFANQVLRRYPNVTNSIKTGELTQEDVVSQIKSTMEMLAIGTDGVRPDDKELQAEYDKKKAENKIDYPTLYTIRMLVTADSAQARTVIDGLKKSGDFRSAAATLGAPPEQAASAARATVYTQAQLPASVTRVLDTLTPNQISPDPIEFTPPTDPSNPQAPAPMPRYMVAQLVAKDPGKTPTLGDIREQIVQMALEDKYPQWTQHAAVRIAEYTEKANIEIMVDKYKPLLAGVILPNAKRTAAMATGGMGAPGAGAGGGAVAPSGAPPSGSPATGANP